MKEENILDKAHEYFGDLVLHAYKNGMIEDGSGDVALFLAATMLTEFMDERLTRSGCELVTISDAKEKAVMMARQAIELTKGRMYSKDTGEA